MGDSLKKNNIDMDKGVSSDSFNCGSKIDKEIGMIDIWLTLCKHKKFSLIIFVFCLVIGFGISILKKPVYKSRAVFEIGFITNINLQKEFFEDPETLVDRINATYRNIYVAAKYKYKRILHFSSKGKDPLTANKNLEKLLQDLILKHKKYSDKNKLIYNEKLNIINKQINELQDIKTKIGEELKIPNTKNEDLSSLLIAEFNRNELGLVQLKKSKTDLMLILTPLNFQDSSIIRGPTKPSTNKYQSLLKTLIISSIIGIVFVFYYIYLREKFIDKRKNNKNKR